MTDDEQLLQEVKSYILEKIKADFPFQSVEIKVVELDGEDMVGIAVCDQGNYTYVVPYEDPRVVLQKMPPIVIQEDY